MTLPVCAARRVLAMDERAFYCAHPFVQAPNSLVSASICRSCSHAATSSSVVLRRTPLRPPETDGPPKSWHIAIARQEGDELGWLSLFLDTPATVSTVADSNQSCAGAASRMALAHLDYIVEWYDRLADMTLFLPGNAAGRIANFTERVELLDGKSAYQEVDDAVCVYAGDDGDGTTVSNAFHSVLNTEPPAFFAAGAANGFAVARDAIHARPRSFFQSARKRLAATPDSAWATNYLWRELFKGPRSPEESASRGVITSSNEGYFEQLLFLLASLHEVGNLATGVFDLGLTSRQREKLADWPGVRVLPRPNLPAPQAAMADVQKPEAWLKPVLMTHTPFDETLWIDADCIVLRDLSPIWKRVASGPFIVMDPFQLYIRNKDELYGMLPTPPGCLPSLYANTGVFGFRRDRDWNLLAAWTYAFQAAVDAKLRALVAFQDQGLFNWALYRLRMGDVIEQEPTWNHLPRRDEPILPAMYRTNKGLWDHLRDAYPDAGIIHWMGDAKLPNALSRDLLSTMWTTKGLQGP